MRTHESLGKKTAVYLLLGAILSFLGWALETLLCSWVCGRFCDRGFLFLPFCTIYGLCVLSVYALMGTPRAGGLFLRKVTRFSIRLPLYFFLSVLLPTAAELVTGLFFDRVLGERLWDYSAYPLHLDGLICLPFSLLWGVLITLFMWFGFSRMRQRLFALREWPLRITAAFFVLALAVDGVLGYLA